MAELLYNVVMFKQGILITKANGKVEPFDYRKLEKSLKKSGASLPLVKRVAEKVEREIHEGASTSLIYQRAHRLLSETEKHSAARYSLRRALLGLGPTGFPFEKFVGQIFKAQGFNVLNDQMIKGGCAEHEVDVIAWNDKKLLMAELKFHNQIGEKTDLKVALYVKARFEDLSTQYFDYGRRRQLDEGWLITNTKFSQSAISYGLCAKVAMIGWSYPARGNLQELIESTHLHPITCLTTLGISEKQNLLQNGVVLCQEVKADSGPLKFIGLSDEKIKMVRDEATLLCG
ncbi:MAG: ATP cone domain-containing protein [Patescibacteria group bacterium]